MSLDATPSSSVVDADKLQLSSTNYVISGTQADVTNINYLSAHRNNVYRWLSATIPSVNYHAALAARLENTGTWFISGARFKEWKSEPDIFLWVHGTPGCGKTVLSASIIEDVLSSCQPGSSSACAYFYFDGRDSQKELQLHQSLVRSLIRQFSSQCDLSSDPLNDLYNRCHNGGSQPSIESLQNTLLHLLDMFQKAYIVIDSLDECTERKVVLNWIKDMTDWKKGKLHLLATSRNEEDITERLEIIDPTHINMTNTYVNTDIEMFINHMLEKDQSLERWDESVQASIRATLLDSADGMFRLVSLQINELQDCYSQDALEEQLRCLPGGLDEFYDRILLQINKKHREEALRILQWLTFSARPLQLDEVAQVVGVVPDPDRGLRFKRSRVYRDPRLILHACSSLVTCSRDGIIKLAHMSVKDYLVSQRHPAFRINEIVSHTCIAETCLAYLLQFDTLDDVTPATLEKFPLANYAARYWTSHVQSVSKDGSSIIQGSGTLQKLIGALLQKSITPAFITWVRLCDIDGDQNQKLERSSDDIPSTLYYASLAGLWQAIPLLLDQGADVNAVGGKCHDALQAASYAGHENIVKLLLDGGADVHAQGGKYTSALQAASCLGHYGIAKLLLERGADVNAWSENYGSALQGASSGGYDTLVKLFLTHKVDVNAQSGFYGNALQAASSHGHETIVKTLLENGASVNVSGGNYYSALYAASSAGHEGIVKLLLDNGADVNSQGIYYGSALYGASQGGYEKIVNLLLEKGADLNSQRGFYGSPLQAASFEGHELVVRLLLEKGGDVNVKEGQFGSELYGASHGGHEGVVKLLLEKGADVNAHSGFYGNALYGASHRGHQAIVKLLLEAKAKVNDPEDTCFGDALYAASHAGNTGIAELLLEHGADVNARGGYYGNALQAASSQGYLSMVTLLLEKGAEADAQGGFYGNALQAAASQGNIDVVNALLEKGVDVNAKGGYHGNALSACLNTHVEIANLLKEKGAVIDIPTVEETLNNIPPPS